MYAHADVCPSLYRQLTECALMLNLSLMTDLVVASAHDLTSVELPLHLRQRVSVDLRGELHVLALASRDGRQLRQELRGLGAAGLALSDRAIRTCSSGSLGCRDGSWPASNT